mgnify:CR=1 FL=1
MDLVCRRLCRRHRLRHLYLNHHLCRQQHLARGACRAGLTACLVLDADRTACLDDDAGGDEDEDSGKKKKKTTKKKKSDEGDGDDE